MSEFIGYTIGLQATHPQHKIPRLIKIEFERQPDGRIRLIPVSGHTLSQVGQTAFMTQAQFSSLPTDGVARARVAFEFCDWTV